jgi:hypothetical protein
MEGKKENKVFAPVSDKAELVRIKFRTGRAATGVEMDADGFAFVDAATAEYLIKINYADKAEEK